MRIVVTGTSGSGKSTLARQIARRYGLPLVDLDAINWQANWHDIARHDPDVFIARVKQATECDAWVVDGNYAVVRDHLWLRATHILWLDYDLSLVMVRVVTRTFARLILRTPLWAGNREQWRFLLDPDHPIRWAWSSHARRRQDMLERIQRPEYAGLTILRLRKPRDARTAVARLC